MLENSSRRCLAMSHKTDDGIHGFRFDRLWLGGDNRRRQECASADLFILAVGD